MAGLTGARMTREASQQLVLARNVARTQTQIATGKRIERASEDPVAAARISELTRVVAETESWSSNISLATSLASQTDGVLSHLSDRAVHAQELYVMAGNPALGPTDRGSIAQELRLLAAEMEGLAATRNSLGQPLFATGAASAIPIGDSQMSKPAPSAQAVFEMNGVLLADQMRAAADVLDIADPVLRKPGYDAWLTKLDALTTHVAQARAAAGVEAARLAMLGDRLETHKVDVLAERSGLADTDIAEAVARLNTQQLTLEAAQAAFARIHRRTLFDLLS